MKGILQSRPKPSDCAITSSQKDLANGVISIYGTYDNVLKIFAPKFQGDYALQEYRCYFGTAPMLIQLFYAYGKSAPIEWLSYQITDLNRYANCKMMTDFQVMSLAQLIYKDYYYLKLTEVMLFFNKIKSAEYGKLFFGSVDTIPVMSALKKFAEERAEIVRKKEAADARAEREKPRTDVISPEEFKKSEFYKNFIKNTEQ